MPFTIRTHSALHEDTRNASLVLIVSKMYNMNTDKHVVKGIPYNVYYEY